MNKTLNNIIMFTAGAVIGFGVAWFVTKTKYEKIAQEEIDSVKETYADMFKKTKTSEEAVEDPEEPENRFEKLEEDAVKRTAYSDIIASEGYDTKENMEEKEEKNDMDEPYVIAPEEFGENNYKRKFLTYYTDGVLEDDYDGVIKDSNIDKLIGRANLNHIGDYEADIVHVRNDRLRTDYEITMDSGSFSEN